MPETATSVDMSSEKASMEQKSKGLGFVCDHGSSFSSIRLFISGPQFENTDVHTVCGEIYMRKHMHN